MQFARLARSRAALAPAALLGQHLGHRGQPATCHEESSSSSSGVAPLLRVSYMSTMRGDAASARKDIERIVEHSIPANQKAQLSGHMCYDARLKTVWQVIEGRGDLVTEKWKRIRADARHAIDEDTVSVEPVEDRRYPVGWGLRFTTFDDALPISPRASEIGGRKHEVEVRDGQLMQLAYKSTVVEHHGEEMHTIKKVVPHAMLNNAKKSITGWMLYNDRTLTVYQILEGPRDAVEGLWSRISQDPRHVVIADSVHRRTIDFREFPNWSMAMDEVEQPAWATQGY